MIYIMKNNNLAMNIYYKIWVDCIIKAQSIPANKNNWKLFTLIFMTITMSINFACFMSILQRNILGLYFYHFEVDFFPGTKLDALIIGFVLFVLPNLLLNYYLIFRNNRYEKLINKYKSYRGKLFFIYFFASLAIPLIILIISQVLY